MNTTKELRTNIGQSLKDRRESLGLTVEEISGQLGISVNTMKGIESGRFAWDIDLHVRLCELLKADPCGQPGKELEWLFTNRKFLNVSAIEAEIGMPERTLRHYLGEVRELPAKWEQPLFDWIKMLRGGV